MRPIMQTLALGAALLSSGAAMSHVVLQDALAAAGSGYRATFQVGHGCDGAATTAITVRLPEGFQGAKPMPKPGWTLRTSVAEISWTANGPDNALPDAWYDEFVLRGTTPAHASAIWFKVVQSCGAAHKDWVEVPASGTSTQGLKAPAALLELIDSGSSGHQH